MSKLDELVTKYVADLNEIGAKVDEDLLRAVAKSQGPSIYLPDASLVSCSDQTELDRVKANFLVGKLGRSDDAANQAACDAVCKQYAGSNRKHRVVFYYLLLQQLGIKQMP